jgi:hypothetical protein
MRYTTERGIEFDGFNFMSAKRTNTVEDFNKPYEPNVIGIKGILYFGVGLLILILITFALMWALLRVMVDQAAETKDVSGPMSMSERDRLPPEPRLQAAPGFGVESGTGRTNLELRASQSEYREIQNIWSEEWSKGQIDPKTGTQVTMSVPTAKELLLQQNLKVNPSSDPNFLDQSRLFVTDSSAGRMLSAKHR